MPSHDPHASIQFEKLYSIVTDVMSRWSEVRGIGEEKARDRLARELESLSSRIQSDFDFHPLSRTSVLTVMDFAINLCVMGGEEKKDLRIVSIRKYFTLIAKALVLSLGTREVYELTKTDWTQVYGNILERNEDKNRQLAFAYCRRHHRIVESSWHVATGPDWDRLRQRFGVYIGTQRTPTKPRLVTERQYLGVLEQIAKHGLDPISCLQLQAVAILAYRCGLRHGEIFALQCQEISLDPQNPCVLVRRSCRGRTKTRASVRRTRPCPQWREGERKIIGDLLSFIRTLPTASRQTRVLCTTDATPLSYTPPSFSLLIRAIRHVTQDDNTRLHDLRHSFVTRRLLKLALSTCPVRAGHHYEQILTLAREIGLDPDRHDGADSPFVAMREIGHANFATTFHTYTHLPGEIIRLFVSGDLELTHSAVAYCLGEKGSCIRKRSSRKRHRSPERRMLEVRSSPEDEDEASDGPAIDGSSIPLTASLLPCLHRRLIGIFRDMQNDRGLDETDGKLAAIAARVETGSGYIAYGLSLEGRVPTPTEARDMHCGRLETWRLDRFLKALSVHLMRLGHWEEQATRRCLGLWIVGKRRGAAGISFKSDGDLLAFLEGAEHLNLGKVVWQVNGGPESGTAGDIRSNWSDHDTGSRRKLVLHPVGMDALGTQKTLHRALFLIAVHLDIFQAGGSVG